MKMTDKAEAPPFPKTEPGVVYSLAMDRVQTQLCQIEALDSKIGTLLGFSGAVLAILAAFLALREGAVPGHALALLCISGTAFLGIALGALRAYYTKHWEVGPDLDEAWQYAREHEERLLAWWAAESFTECFKNNQDNVNLKVRVVKLSVALVVIQAVTLVIGLGLISVNQL